jgi:hypothetical protein
LQLLSKLIVAPRKRKKELVNCIDRHAVRFESLRRRNSALLKKAAMRLHFESKENAKQERKRGRETERKASYSKQQKESKQEQKQSRAGRLAHRYLPDRLES